MDKKTISEYVEYYYSLAFKYEEDVTANKIIACNHIKKAISRRKVLHDKYYYSSEAVKKVIRFFYYVKLSQHGVVTQFKPAPWQMWVVMNIFGYYSDSDFTKRLFKDVLIWIARKSGKTSLGAILAIYSLAKEERSAESYVLATTQNQANQALKYAKEIVNDSPALKKRIKVMQYQLRTNINGTGIFRALTSDANTLDGLNPSFSIIDEAHAHPTKDLYNILKTGTLARDNPMMLTISTAGFYKDFPFYNDVNIGKKVLDNELEDDSTFYALFTLDDVSEIDNPDMWVKANPSLGVTMTLDDMIIAYKKASLTVTDKLNFQVKNLNVFADSADTWISDSDYTTCFVKSNLDKLKGNKAYIGLDLSATKDLASLAVVVENTDTCKMETKTEFYFPTTENDNNKIRNSGIDLTGWINKGWITEHKNKIIDYDKIFDRIKYYNDNYDVQGLMYDPYSAQILMSELESKLLIDLIPARQNFGLYNFPMKYLERLIYTKQINLTKNPVLRWCFRNVVIATDQNGYIRPVKNKSKDSIDGLVALLMAIGLYININWDSISRLLDSYNYESENKQ